MKATPKPISNQDIIEFCNRIQRETGYSYKIITDLAIDSYVVDGFVDENKILRKLGRQEAKNDPTPNFSLSGSYLLLGETGSGKSSLVNRLIGRTVAIENKTSRSQTESVDIYQNEELILIDTPGLFDTRLEISNSMIMDDVCKKIEERLELNAKLDCLFLLWSPTSSRKFRFQEIRNQILKIFGGNVMESLVLVINRETKNWTDDHDLLVNHFLGSEKIDFPFVLLDIKLDDISQITDVLKHVKPFNEIKFNEYRKAKLQEMWLKAENERKEIMRVDDHHRKLQEEIQKKDDEIKEKLKKQQEENEKILENERKKKDQIIQQKEKENKEKLEVKQKEMEINQNLNDYELQEALKQIEFLEQQELNQMIEATQKKLREEYDEKLIKQQLENEKKIAEAKAEIERKLRQEMEEKLKAAENEKKLRQEMEVKLKAAESRQNNSVLFQNNDFSFDSRLLDSLNDSTQLNNNAIYRDFNPSFQPNIYSQSAGPLKKDGTPDMRYSVNRLNLSSGPIPLKKDGTPDMRYTVNKKMFGRK